MCVHTIPVFGCASCIERAELSAYKYPSPKRHGVPNAKTPEEIRKALEKRKKSERFVLNLKGTT